MTLLLSGPHEILCYASLQCCIALCALESICLSHRGIALSVRATVLVHVAGGQAAVEGLQGQDSLSVDFNAEEVASPRAPSLLLDGASYWLVRYIF